MAHLLPQESLVTPLVWAAGELTKCAAPGVSPSTFPAENEKDLCSDTIDWVKMRGVYTAITINGTDTRSEMKIKDLETEDTGFGVRHHQASEVQVDRDTTLPYVPKPQSTFLAHWIALGDYIYFTRCLERRCRISQLAIPSRSRPSCVSRQ